MIELQAFGPADFSRLIGWIDSYRELIQWSGGGFEYPLTESQLERYLCRVNERNSPAQVFKAVVRESNDAVGHVELGRIDREQGTARIGRVLIGKPYRGQGYGSKMLATLLSLGFKEYGLRRIELGVYDFNAGAIRCYEKAGFVREGLRRKQRRAGEEFWNLMDMAILKEEWAIRASG
ncbi:MAG: GNAT family N-acetyltransferase [Elusimicrobia bacterium]|nr:GNAT family N-acetyltransferase [Elusimicrobiota bacterium]